ncbi:MAG: hypothetical protein LC102_06490 [Ignavibacteriales bacterium]|jgi:hypothetical protein|nr:MAG: hypothetical protein F9K26_08530 [Ignavibacteriaceae bacterium]MBW7873319.1 hypothetical protein [Ignavibacteria bacterium]MCZ2143056.1 hypothetical protein [Ignavibacteriales bacterium]OQY79593.1 MAG: hypothetical protein B6D45_00535 [Ignavibacteriales bacterium UTCHB3]MBV6444746.1 hypothetical protein [Ignavibacteriaceae bacterium]
MDKSNNTKPVKSLFAVIFALFIAAGTVETSYAQARIGSTSYDIISEFRSEGITWQTANDGEKYLACNLTRAFVCYFFDDDDRCSLTLVFPKRQGDLNFYCQKYNDEAVIISDTKWKLYLKEGILNIELIYTDEGSYFFRIWE